jgi:hypothetical protein
LNGETELRHEICEMKSCLNAALSIHVESRRRPKPVNGASNRQVTFSLLTLNETIVNVFFQIFSWPTALRGNRQFPAFLD